MNAEDQRLDSCRSACDSVEQVLKDLRPGSAFRMRQAQLVADEAAGLIADELEGPSHASPDSDWTMHLDDLRRSREVPFSPPTRSPRPLSPDVPAMPVSPSAASGAVGGNDPSSAPTLESKDVMRHMVAAMLAENEAMEQDRAGKRRMAIKSYAECRRSLAAAISCCPEDAEDSHKLVQHRKEVGSRLKYLRNLADFEEAVPIDSHIQPVELSCQVFSLSDGESSVEAEPEKPAELVRVEKATKKKKKEPLKDSSKRELRKDEDWKSIAACAAMGAGALTVGISGALAGGLIVLTGTAAASVGALAGVGGAVAGAHVAARDDAVGTAARKAGSLAVAQAEKAKQVASEGKEKVKGASAESVRASLLQTASEASSLLDARKASLATSSSDWKDKLTEARASLLDAAQQVSTGWASLLEGSSAESHGSRRRHRAASQHEKASRRSSARSSTVAASSRRSKLKESSAVEVSEPKQRTRASKTLKEREFV